MSSSWIRTAFKYALMLAPAAFLAGLVAIVGIGTWVTAILREPTRFAAAPVLIQKFTRAAYWHTRKHWHTVPDCVVFDRGLLYRPKPGSCLFENAEFSVRMHFGPAGERSTPEPRPPAAGEAPKPRVIVIGDSHAMGWGVEDGETFASVLASEYGYPVLNLAVSSYGTARELLHLNGTVTLGPDDFVVIQYCDNDLEENRRFASDGKVGPYDRAELDRLFAYQPTPVEPLAVAGLILRLLTDDIVAAIGGSRRNGEGRQSLGPTAAFMATLAAFPQLAPERLLIVAINGPGLRSHLSATELRAAGWTYLEPQLTAEDFLDIDDHMRPQGHRKVAALIAEALRPARRQFP